MKTNQFKNFTLSLAIAMATFISVEHCRAGTVTPKREFRSTWFTTHVNIDWPQTKGSSAAIIEKQKEEMIKYIDGFERMNLNGACFQVRAQCDAIYKSSYEPWSAVLTGTRGKDPGWDPLEYCIDECHKRGLECYAWINPFRWSNGPQYSTPTDKDFIQKGWILSYDGYYVLNPAIPEARAHILKVCKEIVDNYAIDGVLFDDYFYPNNLPENSSAGDWDLYKASGTTMGIGDWRRENINLFVREFQAMIEEAHPDMRFGISPAGVAGASASKFGVDPLPPAIKASDWQYSTIYSDPLAWLYEGSIDFISPQIYWQTYHATAPYEPLCKWWSNVADKFGRHFYSSQNVYFFTNANNTNSWNEVATQVEMNRKYSEPAAMVAPGTIYYSSKYFYGPALTGLGDHLLDKVNRTKALVPVVTWKKVPTFGAPANINYDGKTLSWTAIDAPRSIMRYTIYAIPGEVSLDKAYELNGDGLSNDYLLRVCYESAFEVPEEYRTGYWYAVCAYDGLGNEFSPAIACYPEGESSPVSLVSPVNDATVAWSQEFKWSQGKADAAYVLSIASDKDFRNLLYKSERLETNSVTVDLIELEPKTQYFWNVECFETGKLGAVSETASFITSDYSQLTAAELLKPVNGTEIDKETVFEWNHPEGAQSYTLEISSNDAFDKILYGKTTSNTSVVFNPSYIGQGNYFWRVKAEAPLKYPSYSAVRSFSVPALPIGSTEPGYSIKTDPASYVPGDGMEFENLWVRSVENGYENISFGENGSHQRGMVAVDNYVYLTRRDGNSEGAAIFLEKYDGLTGEHVSSLALSDEGRLPYYPLNNIVKDDNGNVVISNLSISAQSTPVVLHMVDLETGDLTQVAQILLGEYAKARIDHLAVTGNVASGNFVVYMAVASAGDLVRVTYSGGKETARKITTFKNFWPADRTSFTIAPMVTPVTADRVLVDGGGIGLGLYDMASATLVDNIGACSGVKSGATTANGSARFSLGTKIYTVYTASDEKTGFKFGIVQNNSTAEGFANGSQLVVFPAEGLGKVASGTASTPVSVVKDTEGTARVYVYAAGNGIAAYRLSDSKSFANCIGVDDDELVVTREGTVVRFNRPVQGYTVYSIGGVKLLQGSAPTSEIVLPVSGPCIVVADGKAFKM